MTDPFKYAAKAVSKFSAGLIARSASLFGCTPLLSFDIECVGADGTVKWKDQCVINGRSPMWLPCIGIVFLILLGLIMTSSMHLAFTGMFLAGLVTTVGKNDTLAKYFQGSAYTAAWFLGLVDNAAHTYAAGDTMASHAGWTEVTGYSQGTRPAWSGGTPAAGSVDNSASTAQFSINATNTVAGAFLTSNSTKGGTTGILYGAADFSGGSRAVINGDTLNVTATLSQT